MFSSPGGTICIISSRVSSPLLTYVTARDQQWWWEEMVASSTEQPLRSLCRWQLPMGSVSPCVFVFLCVCVFVCVCMLVSVCAYVGWVRANTSVSPASITCCYPFVFIGCNSIISHKYSVLAFKRYCIVHITHICLCVSGQ